jgi:hypothetical protein
MNTIEKQALGQIFGEVLRIQKHLGICRHSDSAIHGLVNHHEHWLNLYFDKDPEGVFPVPAADHKKVEKTLRKLAEKPSAQLTLEEVEVACEKAGADKSNVFEILSNLVLQRANFKAFEKLNATDLKMLLNSAQDHLR